MSLNPAFAHFFFGIYVIELWKFFTGKFKNFILKDNQGNDVPIETQVFYGTPRAAFRRYKQVNGKVKLPLINFYISDYERMPQFEPTHVEMPIQGTYDHTAKTIAMMKSPGVFSFTVSVNLFAPGRKEMDYMMHALFNAFPKGEVSLVHFPDLVNYPDIYLLMPYTMDLNVTDETEVEGVEPRETLDIYKMTFTLKCNRAFVPYDAWEVPVVESIDFNLLLNELIDNKVSLFSYLSYLRAWTETIQIKYTFHDFFV